MKITDDSPLGRMMRIALLTELGRHRNHADACHVLGIGERTCSQYLRSLGFEPREKIDGPYQRDVEWLMNYVSALDVPAPQSLGTLLKIVQSCNWK